MRKIKKSYKKLYIFLTVILFVFLINSFIWHILNLNRIIIFLLFLTIIFEIIFGFEKDKHRHIKTIMVNMLIYLIIYYICYYLIGILIGFSKSGNYYTWYGIKTFIIPTTIYIITKEYFRYEIFCKAEGNRVLSVYSTIVFILIDISSAVAVASRDYNSIFLLISLTILPTISNNILCSYLTKQVGYKVNIVYLLIINLYQYFIPLIPNPNEYLKAIIEFLLPIILLAQFVKFFETEKDYLEDRDYKKIKISSLAIPLALTIILVYFVSGYFKYYAIAIATGSMTPNIRVGDVVVIKQKDYDYKKIDKGSIIAYKYNDTIVVHRVTRKLVDNNSYYFYTKGDANSKEDNYVVEPDNIIGVVKFKIMKIGLPTIWLNESLK